MTALLVLGLLGVTALFLAGALTYFYRWRVRKRLFPQLPRLWKGERSRFLVSTGLFIVSLLAFMVVSLVSGPSMPEPVQKLAANKPQGPSFDGAPPPPPPPPTPSRQETPGQAEREPVGASTPAPAAMPGGEVRTAAQTAPEKAPVAVPQQLAPVQAPSSADKAANQEPTPQAAPGPAYAQQQQAASQPKKEPKPPSASQKPAEGPSPAVASQETPAQKKQPAPAQAKKQTVKAESAKTQPAETPKAPAKTKEPVKKAAVSKTKSKKPKQAAPKGKTYTVCAASFKDMESAQREAKRLANKGLKGRITKANIKGKGVWYRVCLGEFSSPGQAAAKAKAWRDNKVVKTPFVIRLR